MDLTRLSTRTKGRSWTIVTVSCSAALFFALVIVYLLSDTHTPAPDLSQNKVHEFSRPLLASIEDANHIIDRLVREADEQFDAQGALQASSLADAAQTYRFKRGRHPPPGFDVWYENAQSSKSPIIESFFDTIYDNLEPFWSLPPQEIRDFAKQWPTGIIVRNGRAERASGGNSNTTYSTGFYQDMLNHLPNLPDVNLAINDSDESFVMIPFLKMVEHMELAAKTRAEHNQIPVSQMKNEFPTLPAFGTVPDLLPVTADRIETDQQRWDAILGACRPDDMMTLNARTSSFVPVPPLHSTSYTMGSIGGYVHNYTMARNVCSNPNLLTLHGMFIKPLVGIFYTQLRPVFSVSNIVGLTNDILIPTYANWMEKSIYTGAEHKIPWEDKPSGTGWWGTATGGNHTADNWWGFHRLRFVQLLNGTIQSVVEDDLKSNLSIQEIYESDIKTSDRGKYNFPYPSQELFPELAGYGKLGPWIQDLAHGGFVNMFCSMQEFWNSRVYNDSKACNHTDAYYSVVPEVKMDTVMKHKYLPDIDGHGASGRYLGFIRSLSVPIKSTILTEWYDNRLIPWRHFVPLSQEYSEWWGLLQYFLGYKDKDITIPSHDEVGKKIGRQGNEWAARAIRKEDMLVYFHRLILEYARICADDRISMGWVADLLDKT